MLLNLSEKELSVLERHLIRSIFNDDPKRRQVFGGSIILEVLKKIRTLKKEAK